MELKSIGDFTPETPFFLAPMAGFTDGTFRRICEELGAGLTFTEMVSAKGLYYNDKKSMELLDLSRDIKPVGFQIFGSDPDNMAFAAEKLNPLGHKLLDVNMGCPVPKVVKNGDGSALLERPELIYDIIKAMKNATDRPITVKTRVGIHIERGNYSQLFEAVDAMEKGGASLITLHGRTREEYYSGKADINAIKEVKKRVSIPVAGNGDINSYEDAVRMMEETGCDFVAVGRAALGNPWVFRELKAGFSGDEIPELPGPEEKREMILRHYRDMEEAKGEYSAVREMRKFVGKYLKGVQGAAALRGMINTVTNGRDFCKMIEEHIWE